MELNYVDLENEIVKKLEEAKETAFATSADNIVTGRVVCPVNDGLEIMFGTGGDSVKIQQIRKNPNVALISGGLQIEATAELSGHPTKNERYMKLNDEKYPWMKNDFPPDPNDDGVLVVCHPTKITIYKFQDGTAFWDVLYVTDKKAVRL